MPAIFPGKIWYFQTPTVGGGGGVWLPPRSRSRLPRPRRDWPPPWPGQLKPTQLRCDRRRLTLFRAALVLGERESAPASCFASDRDARRQGAEALGPTRIVASFTRRGRTTTSASFVRSLSSQPFRR